MLSQTIGNEAQNSRPLHRTLNKNPSGAVDDFFIDYEDARFSLRVSMQETHQKHKGKIPQLDLSGVTQKGKSTNKDKQGGVENIAHKKKDGLKQGGEIQTNKGGHAKKNSQEQANAFLNKSILSDQKSQKQFDQSLNISLNQIQNNSLNQSKIEEKKTEGRQDLIDEKTQ